VSENSLASDDRQTASVLLSDTANVGKTSVFQRLVISRKTNHLSGHNHAFEGLPRMVTRDCEPSCTAGHAADFALERRLSS
jgi:hypothetical protein